MRLVGITMVKNEADVIEWFVRHNAMHVDHLVVLDHSSTDETRESLLALKKEGLPITLHRDATPGYPQSELMTRLMRLAVSTHHADWVIPLDADEFLKVEGGLHAALEHADRSSPVLATWHNYVPKIGPSHRLSEVARVRLPLTGTPGRKVMVPARLAGDERYLLHTGSHALLERQGNRGRSVTAPIDEKIMLGHLPFRTPEQLMAKAVNGYLAHRVTAGAEAKTTAIVAHWRVIAQGIIAGETVDWADLASLVGRAYQSLPDSYDGTDIIDDPLPSEVERTYPFRARSAASLIAAWADALLDSVVR